MESGIGLLQVLRRKACSGEETRLPGEALQLCGIARRGRQRARRKPLRKSLPARHLFLGSEGGLHDTHQPHGHKQLDCSTEAGHEVVDNTQDLGAALIALRHQGWRQPLSYPEPCNERP